MLNFDCLIVHYPGTHVSAICSCKSVPVCTIFDFNGSAVYMAFSLPGPDFVSNIFRDMQTQLSESSLVAIESEEVVFSIWVSFAEVYNENVYDLLEPMELKKQKRQNLVLGEDKKGQVYIKGKDVLK